MTMFKKIALVFALLAAMPLMASAHEFKLGDLTIGHPWSRATPGGAKIGGGYLTITNNGSAPDRLVSISIPTTVADHAEMHEMATKDGIMTMRPMVNGVTIEPGKTVAFVPGGYHVMMMGLKGPLKEGDRVKAELTFERAGKVEVTFNVEGMGAQHPAAADADHGMPGMSGHKM
jgi:copper(I)-binding protein